MKNKVPSFNEFFKSMQAEEAKEFEVWSVWYCEHYENNNFPWDEFEAKERELAVRLADTGVKITY